MSVFFLIVLSILLLGPLRRPLLRPCLRHARFTVPAMIAFPVSFAIIYASATAGGAPSQAVVLFALPAAFLFACLFGAEIKRWYDRVFGPRQQQQPPQRRD